MTTQSSCPICDSKQATQISSHDRNNKPLVTVLCESCGHVYNDPIPSNDELERFYKDDYRRVYKGAYKPRLRQISRNFEGASQFIARWSWVLHQSHNILDVGCGSGEFLYLMKSLGHNVRGIEPNIAYAEHCNAVLKLDVQAKFLDNLMNEHERFDFIRLSHVLEHSPDPVRALTQIKQKLNPSGIVYVEVPNIKHYAHSKARGSVFHYGHISNFSPWTLRAAANRAGLSELEECKDKMEGQTGIFLRHSSSFEATYAINNDNVEDVRKALAQHYTQRRESAYVVKKFLRKGLVRLREVADTIAAAGSAKRMGDLYTSRTKQRLLANGAAIVQTELRARKSFDGGRTRART